MREREKERGERESLQILEQRSTAALTRDLHSHHVRELSQALSSEQNLQALLAVSRAAVSDSSDAPPHAQCLRR